MAEDAGSIGKLDLWKHRLGAVTAVLPYGMLIGCALLAWALPGADRRPLRDILALAGLTAAWLLLREVLDRARLPERAERWVGPAHFAVLLVLLCLLVLSTPLYGFFGFTGYLQAMRYLRGPVQIGGVALSAVPCADSQLGGTVPTTAGDVLVFLALLVLNLGLAGVLTLLDGITEAQARHHRRVAGELAAANERLAAMLEENAGLHAQLVAQAREAGVADERRRMAREIHDTIAQGLAGIITQLEAAEGTPVGPERHRHLANASRLARESLAAARRAVSALRPEQLEDAELPAALAEVVEQWRELHGVPAELTVTGTARPLHPEVEVTLLRAAQESLANTAKHAAASRVGITLSYMEDLVSLDARDDGTGFDPGQPAPAVGGFGLTAMRQRVRRLAGQLAVESEPGFGTAVSVTVPAIPRESSDG